MNASVEPVNSGMTEGFKWSLKPILLYLKLLGVNFEPSKPDPTRSGVLAFHLQRLAGFSVTILPFLWFICLPQDMTWNTTIEFLSFQYFPIGIHWGLLIVRQKEKDKFWELIKQIETRFEYGSGIFRRFRRLSIATLLCCLFWVIILVASLLKPRHQSVDIDLMINILALVTYAKLEIGSLTFCVAGLIAVESFRHIAHEIETGHHKEGKRSADGRCRLGTSLKMWKSKHILLYDYAAQLNQMFNFPLLIEVCHIFISLTTASLNVLSGQREISGFYAATVIKNIIVLFLLCYVADGMRSAATHISLPLVKIESPSLDLQLKVDSLRTQTLQIFPQIKVYELFEIGQHLFPTLLGTTLTYMVVMYQIDQPQS